jgi:hypothetical protein
MSDPEKVNMKNELDIIRDEGGFEWTPLSEKKVNKNTLTVDDNGLLTFTPEILEKTGWKEGDVLEWIDRGDGSFELRKIDES